MERARKLSHVIAFDDAPFDRERSGDVTVVAAVFAGLRLDGVLTTRVRRDGANSASAFAKLILGCRFREHLQLILLQGVAVAGFNVVDVPRLSRLTGLPVLVVSRKDPSLDAIRDALLTRIRGGARKWRLIERLGAMEPVRGVFVQRWNLSADEAEEVIDRLAVHGNIPEPLRTAHLIAGGITTGESRGRC